MPGVTTLDGISLPAKWGAYIDIDGVNVSKIGGDVTLAFANGGAATAPAEAEEAATEDTSEEATDEATDEAAAETDAEGDGSG